MTKRAKQGQSLVEFALVVPIFLVLMMGLFDGTRLLFQYNELQDAARVGARWAAVNVNRDTWGYFSSPGNIPGDRNVGDTSGITLTGAISSTILGQVSHSLTGIPVSQTWLNIAPDNVVNPSSIYNTNSTPGGAPCQGEVGLQVGYCTGMPITVTVSYTFTPILSFSMVHIPLQGRAVSYHE